MCNVTNAGGSFLLEGSLVLDVPQGAVPQGTSVTITAIAVTQQPQVASGYTVHKVWQIDGNKSLPLTTAANLNHPLVGGLTTDEKLRFYSHKDNISGSIPCNWNPRPESPLGDAYVDGGTGNLPPDGPSNPSFRSFLCLVQIP